MGKKLLNIKSSVHAYFHFAVFIYVVLCSCRSLCESRFAEMLLAQSYSSFPFVTERNELTLKLSYINYSEHCSIVYTTNDSLTDNFPILGGVSLVLLVHGLRWDEIGMLNTGVSAAADRYKMPSPELIPTAFHACW